MKTDTTRRGLLAGIPAFVAMVSGAAVALPAVIQPAPELPDAVLLKLVDEWFAAHEEQERLREIYNEHEAAWFAGRRKLEEKIPEALKVRPDDVEIGIPWLKAVNKDVYGIALEGSNFAGSDINSLRQEKWHYTGGIVTDTDGVDIYRSWWATPAPAARARADEIIAAYDKWHKKFERRPRAYRAAERRYKEAVDKCYRLRDEVIPEIRATTLRGLAAKARVVIADDVYGEEELAASIARDLAAMMSA
jgi:hypothetical protein